MIVSLARRPRKGASLFVTGSPHRRASNACAGNHEGYPYGVSVVQCSLTV